MLKIWGCVAWVVLGLLLSECTSQEIAPAVQGKVGYNVVLPDNLYADSAQVLFFRNLADSDTLILRKTIYGISTTLKRFEFDLPAGYYTVAFFGNLTADRIVARPPYSQDSVWLSYQGGIVPPDILYGRNYLNVGTDSTTLAGMILMVSRIELTLKNIPAGIERIEASILHTSSGLGFYGYLKENMNPPLSMNLENPHPDSTYTLMTNCFPSAQNNAKSTIEVNCYNVTNELVYSGSSKSFLVKYGVRMIIACSFDQNPVLSKSREIDKPGIESMILEWSYDEKNI